MTDDGFAAFLAAIARTPLLTAAEERALAQRIERGDLAAKDRLVQANLRLVVHVAKRYVHDDHGLTLPDLVQEGTLGLVRAAERFDWRRGHRFSTYATIWIRQSIGRAIAKRGRATRFSLDAPVGDDADATLADLIPDDVTPGPEARAELASLGADVRRTIAALPPRERAVLELRYGLASEGEATTAETAARLRLRPQQVRRLEELALRRLRATLSLDPPIQASTMIGGSRLRGPAGGGELLRVA
jgi:RNA polymerase primary sigma factor